MRKFKPDDVAPEGWLFYVTRPVAVIVKGTYAEAQRARNAISHRVLDEQYVRWFDGIPKVDRALLTEDPADLMDKGRIEEY